MLRALLEGMISYTLACRHSSLAHTDSQGLPGATHSMNICDWTGQEEREVDCLSDEDRVFYADQGVWQPLQDYCRGRRVNPHSQLYPTGTGCARTGRAALEWQLLVDQGPGQLASRPKPGYLSLTWGQHIPFKSSFKSIELQSLIC